MATQQAGAPPKTKRFGIFPHPVRKFVILFVLILFVIAGIIGIQQAWGNLSNILAVIFGVVGVILGILTFWPSTKTNEASAPTSPVSPQLTPVQVNIYNNSWQPADPQPIPSSRTNNANNNELAGQDMVPNTGATNVQPPPLKNAPTVHPPVSPFPTPGPSAQQDDEDEDDISQLIQDLIDSSQSVFDNVIATYRPPSGVARTGSIPFRAEELVRTAKKRGDLLKLRNAYYSAMGMPPPVKKVRRELTNGTKHAAEVVEQAIPTEREQNIQVALSSNIVSQEHQEAPTPQAEDDSADHPDSSTEDTLAPGHHLLQGGPTPLLPNTPPITPPASTATVTSGGFPEHANQESRPAPPDQQPLEQARRLIREAHDAVHMSKVIFEGRGDIQQIHYLQATVALRQVASCVQNLHNILQTISPLPAYLDRERLIMDLRHISTEVGESIKQIENYGTLHAHQRERNRKDTESRLSTVLTHLDDLGRRVMSKGPL